MLLVSALFNHLRVSPGRLVNWLTDFRGVSGEELPVQARGKNWSLLLSMMGVTFAGLRRCSPQEWLRHLLFENDYYDQDEQRWHLGTPAAFYDLYGIVLLAASLALTYLPLVPVWWLLLVWAALTVQGTLYQALWRTAMRIVPQTGKRDQAGGNAAEGIVHLHQQLRGLLTALLGLAQFTWLLTLVYYVRFWEDVGGQLATMADALYFSTSLSLLFGVGTAQPASDAALLKIVMAGHLVCAALLWMVAVSRAAAVVASAREPIASTKG